MEVGMVKVKNVGNSIVIVPGEKGREVILSPGEIGEIDEKYLFAFSGKLVEIKTEITEESTENTDEKEIKKRR